MGCCLAAPSHCLNQRWLLISDILRRLPEINSNASAQATILYSGIENCTFKITAPFSRGQWVNIFTAWWLICLAGANPLPKRWIIARESPGPYVIENYIKMQFSLTKIPFKVPSAKGLPFRPDLNLRALRKRFKFEIKIRQILRWGKY